METIVLPDRMTPEVREIVAKAGRNWPDNLRLQPFGLPERWALPRLGNPGRNHAIQLITGVRVSRASHVVLHDADLFLFHPGQLDRQFERCCKERLACLGVSPAWDQWLADHGLSLAATWELCAQVEWVRSFPPVQHMAHARRMFGERHVFDTTYYPQALTEPHRIGIAPNDDIVHFNYVISNYRRFIRRGQVQWGDGSFRLLLVSLFVAVFDRERAGAYRLPSLGELGSFLGDSAAPVRYPPPEDGAHEYPQFRRRLSKALAGPWVSEQQQQLTADALRPFDRFYGYEDKHPSGMGALPGPGGPY